MVQYILHYPFLLFFTPFKLWQIKSYFVYNIPGYGLLGNCFLPCLHFFAISSDSRFQRTHFWAYAVHVARWKPFEWEVQYFFLNEQPFNVYYSFCSLHERCTVVFFSSFYLKMIAQVLVVYLLRSGNLSGQSRWANLNGRYCIQLT